MELVRRAYQAGAMDSAEAALPFVAPDAVWYAPPGWLERTEYHGPEGVRELMTVFTDNFEDYKAELHEFRDAGDRVVGLFWLVGRIKGSDKEVRQPMAAVYSRFRDDRVGESRFFLKWEEALETAGLRE